MQPLSAAPLRSPSPQPLSAAPLRSPSPQPLSAAPLRSLRATRPRNPPRAPAQARHGVTDVLMANLAAYEFWRAEWVGAARIRSLAAGASGAAGEEGEASRAAAAGSWDGVDDAQRDWCCAHGLVPLALTAVREVVERVMQVRGGRGARSCGSERSPSAAPRCPGRGCQQSRAYRHCVAQPLILHHTRRNTNLVIFVIRR